MHPVLSQLPEWQQLEQRLAELDRLRRLYAARDLQARQEREAEQQTYVRAYQAAVEAGEEPPPAHRSVPRSRRGPASCSSRASWSPMSSGR
jgi:hypothetical protein